MGHHTLRAVALAALASAGIAACGSSSKSTSSGGTGPSAATTSVARTTTSATGTSANTSTGGTSTGATASTGTGTGTTGASTSAAGGGLAGKTPKQIVQAAAAAMSSTKSFRVQAQLDGAGGKRQSFSMSIHSADSFELALTLGGGQAQVRLTGGKAYIEGDKTFWTSQADAATAAKLAGKWVVVPASTVGSLTDSLGSLAPSRFGYCLAHGSHGTITSAGTTTIGGQPAVVLKDDGNAPDDQPGTLAVASTGTPYPLRLIAMGTEKPGPKTKCDDGKGGTHGGTILLSDFGQVPAIAAPPNPLDPSSLSGGSSA